MSYLLFARLRDISCPWFVVSLTTFSEAEARKLVQKLDKENWEYTYAHASEKKILDPPKEVH